MTLLRTRSITRLRPSASGFDADGDPVTATTTATEITGVLLAPRTDLGSLGEVNGQPQRRRRRLHRLLPAGVRRDQVRPVRDRRRQVEGDRRPGPWVGHMVGGIEVALERAEG